MASTKTTTSSISPRDQLRELLRFWEPAAGPEGFEGLVARALASFTGLTFRLARSGSQFGRDGATPSGPFSIAMEAKRYSQSVPLQELAGKATLAAHALADDIDVWGLAATVEVGETTQRLLEEILEKSGIHLLTLDWAEAELPMLAVLLAGAGDPLVDWAEKKIGAADHLILKAGLDDVRGDAGYDAALAELRSRLTSSTLGLDSLSRSSSHWGQRHFSDRQLAQEQFAQFLAPLAKPTETIDRPRINSQLEAAVAAARSDPEGNTIVAVLGGEGSGKTWSVVNWWLAADPRPVLLLSIGRMADHLSDVLEPLDMLARLAAQQDGRRDEEAISRWRRRFDRWSRSGQARDRFVVLIDGLNETSGKPWSAILSRLRPATHALGGIVVATCREAFWEREIARRLPFINFQQVDVGDYDDAEFADVLFRATPPVDPSSLPEDLNRFMRNPRICALALTMLPQLANVGDLTIDRLLLEYWRTRLLERGDLLGHDDVDFRDLLVRHAREYRDRPGTDFNRNEWRTRSGAAQRGDGRDIANDLSDIEEGRFFDPGTRAYRFRESALPFVLGLLIADELREALNTGGDDPDQALASILDPIRGFDRVADIVTAAIATASLDNDYPPQGLSALVTEWMSLQNVSEEASESLLPYVAARPVPFLDAFEDRDIERDDGRFLQLILWAASERTAVAEALDARIDGWLGTWSRMLPELSSSNHDERQAKHDAEIDRKLAELTEQESRWFGANCRELTPSGGLAGAALLYMSRKPQVSFARGILAFAFAHQVAGNYRVPHDELGWVLRMNRADHPTLVIALKAEIAELVAGDASDVAKAAAARSLRLLGSLAEERDAEALSPRQPRQYGHREQVDPLDPAAEAPLDIDQVSERLAGIEPTAFWTHMSTTSEDHDLDRSMNLLVRFASDDIEKVLDGVGASVSERSGMPLRQLGWHLPWLSPILSDKTVAAIRQRVAELGETPSLVPNDDADFVMAMMVESVMPSLDSLGQLDLLQSLPPAAPYYLRYSTLAKPMTGADAARRLEEVIDGDPQILERTLIFLSAATTDVTDRLRELIVTCLASDNVEVAAATAELIRRLGDDRLDVSMLEVPVPPETERSWRTGTVRFAIAAALARTGQIDDVEAIPAEYLDQVAARVPAARRRLADIIEASVHQLTRPVMTDDPSDAVVVLEVDEEGQTRINLEDRGEGPKDPLEAIKAINEQMADESGEKFASRQRLLRDQLERFLESLTSVGAQAIARRPYSMGLGELADEVPGRYAAWLTTILATTDTHALRQVQNLGLALAQNYAATDPDLAARTFDHLWSVDPHVTVTVGSAKHPIRYLALFRAGPSEEISALRTKAFEDAIDDAEIERLVMAAEFAEAWDWLDAFIGERSKSALPSDQALAITVASFRTKNDLSERTLTSDWGAGFLSAAAEAGLSRYRRSCHAEHWFEMATKANSPREQWRWTGLGIAAADRRQLLRPLLQGDASYRLIGGDIAQRLNKAADKVTDEAKKTIFGIRRPRGLLES